MITEIKPGVYWVGITDWDIRHFHGHELSTHRGTTYNSYLITDEKTVLVDSVWEPFQDQLIRNISEVTDPAGIDIVVANHAEPDHSGSLPAVMRHAPGAAVLVSKRGAESIPGHYHQPWDFKPVMTGDRISIGKNELVFVEAPMLHLPDSRFTYLTDVRVLMPNDAFGQHYATAFRFNDQVDQEELYEEAVKYYANILTPFSDRVLKKIDEVLALGLPVDVIAPSHGVIWREDPVQIIRKYQEWARQEPKPGAVIVYDTMWGGTKRMAGAIGDGLAAAGIPHKIFHTAVTDRNDLLVEIFKAGTLVVGSPTVNSGPLPGIMPLLAELKGLKFKNKIGAAFGSYGWSGEAMGVLEEMLTAAGVAIACPGIKCKWQPGDADLEKCRALGSALAGKILGPQRQGTAPAGRGA